MLQFKVFRQVLVVNPAVTMTGNFPLCVEHAFNHSGVALQCHCNTKYRNRNLALREQPVQAPVPRSGTIFVYRFHIHVAHTGISLCTYNFGQKCFGGLVSMKHAVFSAFLIVDNKLQCYPCPIWPIGLRCRLTVTDQVSRVGFIVSGRHNRCLRLL